MSFLMIFQYYIVIAVLLVEEARVHKMYQENTNDVL